MWDVNPQTHNFYLQDVERQFAAATRGRSARNHTRLPRLLPAFRRLNEGGARGAFALVAICAVAVLFF